MGWLEFVSAYLAFFLTHSLPVRPPLRPWLQARLGRVGFNLAYSVLSFAVLGWLIAATRRAPFVPVWEWALWQAYVPLVIMLPVSLIIALSVAHPNPFSFGGARNHSFDPSRPGFVRVTRHPLLLALALWAAAHVVPNGDVAHVILFGTFTAFASLGGRLVDRRKRLEMGAEWAQLEAARRATPLIPSFRSRAGITMRFGFGVALYLSLLWVHPILFGVSPLV